MYFATAKHDGGNFMFLHVITWYTVREVLLSLTLDFIHKGGNPDVMHKFCWPYLKSETNSLITTVTVACRG